MSNLLELHGIEYSENDDLVEYKDLILSKMPKKWCLAISDMKHYVDATRDGACPWSKYSRYMVYPFPVYGVEYTYTSGYKNGQTETFYVDDYHIEESLNYSSGDMSGAIVCNHHYSDEAFITLYDSFEEAMSVYIDYLETVVSEDKRNIKSIKKRILSDENEIRLLKHLHGG